MKLAVFILVAMLMSCTRASKPEVSSLKFDFSKISEKGSGLIPQSALPEGSSVCYAVNVMAPDLQNKPGHQCAPPLAIFAGFVPEASELSVEVPFGKDRTVELYAFLPKRGSPCVITDGSANSTAIDPQSIFLVGKLTNQVFDKPEVSLPMPVNFPGTAHSIFADLRMDSSCLNTSSPVVDPNAPVVLKAFLSNTTVSSSGVDESITLNILVKSPNSLNQLSLSHDGPNGNIANGSNTQMFYACTLANINTAGHICQDASVDNYYAIKTLIASQWAPNGLYNISFSVRSNTFLESSIFTGPSYTITNHATYPAPIIETILITPDAGLTSGIGGNVTLKILVQSTAGPDVIDRTLIQPSGDPLLTGILPVPFINCASFIATPAHICYTKTVAHWFFEQVDYFNPFRQNGTYTYQGIRVRNLTNLFSPVYTTLTFGISGNAVPITPTITKTNAFYAFDTDPFTQGIPYYTSSCVRPEGGNAYLGIRTVSTTNADINFINYAMQGPAGLLANGGQSVSGVNLGSNNWQADYSTLISGVVSAPRGSYVWNNISVKNIADQKSAAVQGPAFNLSDSCYTVYSSVASYAGYTCGINSSGKLKCWGVNNNHAIDHGSATPRNYPTVVDGDDSYTSIAVGSIHTCGTNNFNQLKCWGGNGNGQIGDGTFTTAERPKIIDAGTMYMKVSAGTNHTCGITVAGILKCWGRNINGQLGDGTTVDKQSPTVIDSGVQYSYISAGENFTCGITSAAVLKCWGYNSTYQLGDGTTTYKTTPTIINSGTNYMSVRAGVTGTCGVTNTGVLKCWGQNNYGQLGDGTTVNKTTPTIIDAGTTYANVSIAAAHTCGVTLTGVLKCWGQNFYGQLGDGSVTTRTSPTVINSGVVYGTATTGAFHSCATTSAGFMKCWGQNTSYQLGTGNTTGYSLPFDIDL